MIIFLETLMHLDAVRQHQNLMKLIIGADFGNYDNFDKIFAHRTSRASPT